MRQTIFKLAEKYGTPLFILDHERIRENYRLFKKHLPRVQCYYAVKANSNPEIIKTLFNEGSSFDVASYNEFMQVHEYIKHFEEDEKHFYIWDKIIFSNTIKDRETLRKIKKYKPLVTYDNLDELKKIKDHCSTAGLVLRLKVPDTGSQVEMSSKFGAEPAEAYELLHHAAELGLDIEGLSFHVGSQCTNFDNYTRALELTSELLHEARAKGHTVKLIDIGGGFPVPYDAQVPRFEKLADVLNTDFKRLFPDDIEILAEPGRFMVATAAMLVTEIIGKARRDGKIFYHINDGVYHTFSGVVFDHWIPNFHSFKQGKREVCAVVGPTCDSFDKITLSAQLPRNLEIGDRLYTENIGAYSTASTTHFNGFDGAKIIHIHNK
ncbi:MAG: type III PLP-dependent enzyme [Spirochaetes bacterium]|nr:type III PLP-dependent enzyme [Spirochaetota bacterium]HOD16956.1 type III PLP-dependent enzyme [Spirochaetota bacterium]HPG51556.1 type III PLP-dependent enzyme [Spirochaetota bacterium]